MIYLIHKYISSMKVSLFEKFNKFFLFKELNSGILFFITSISYLYSIVILNRWIFVPIGLKSMGRIWHNYIGYQEIGYARRSLWGTFLNITKLNQLFNNEYINSIFIHFLLLTLIYLILSRYIFNRLDRFNFGQLCLIYFSPSFFFHISYATGSSDIVCIFLLIISTLFIRNIFIISFISATGVLIHDLYIFFLPFLLVQILLDKSLKITSLFGSLIFKRYFLFLIILPLTVYLSTHIFGSENIGKIAYEEIAKSKIPLAYESNHPYWSGFYEIFPNKTEYVLDHLNSLKLEFFPKIHLFLIPFSYLCGLLFIIKNYLKLKVDFFSEIIIYLSLLAPLLAFPMVTEYIRFTCLSCILSILFLVRLSNQRSSEFKRINVNPIIIFSFLSPFGIILERVLPIHQFLF